MHDDALREVRRRLIIWMRWHWGGAGGAGRQNFIGAMMARAEGEIPGLDITVPRELTPELEAVEKGVAAMRYWHPIYYELIIDTYVKGLFLFELASAWSPEAGKPRRWSEEKAADMLRRAEMAAGRFIRDMDREISRQALQ